jgi:hypothetical protein
MRTDLLLQDFDAAGGHTFTVFHKESTCIGLATYLMKTTAMPRPALIRSKSALNGRNRGSRTGYLRCPTESEISPCHNRILIEGNEAVWKVGEVSVASDMIRPAVRNRS